MSNPKRKTKFRYCIEFEKIIESIVDVNKFVLRPESINELERLIKLMSENPSMKVEISGHTDSRGRDELNRLLSENRSKAVVDYLIKNRNIGI